MDTRQCQNNLWKSRPGIRKDMHDRAYQEWWYPLVTAEPVKDQQIEKLISQLYRIPDGKEWLFYNVDLSGNDWIHKDFSNYEKDLSTDKVIPGTTQDRREH